MRAVLCGAVMSLAVLAGPAPAASPADEAVAGRVVAHRDLVYARPGGRPLTLDLYLPARTARPVPVILWIHGGGWCAGTKEAPDLQLAVPLGFAVASLDYRLSQTAIFPAQLHDCKAAVRWLRAHAADYHLDRDRIGAAGVSAGGHLAALLGTTADDPALEGREGNPGVSSAVQAVCDFSGPSNLLDFMHSDPAQHPAVGLVTRLLGAPVAEKPALAREASPLAHVSREASPFFIAHGDKDTVVPLEQSVELDAALRQAGVESTLYVIRDGAHGGIDPGAIAGALAFLARHLQRG